MLPFSQHCAFCTRVASVLLLLAADRVSRSPKLTKTVPAIANVALNVSGVAGLNKLMAGASEKCIFSCLFHDHPRAPEWLPGE